MAKKVKNKTKKSVFFGLAKLLGIGGSFKDLRSSFSD